MLVIYRVVRRGRESITGLPKHINMSKPELQDSGMPFTGTGYELSVSPTISIRGCDGPYNSLPPPYAKDFPIRTFPQSPTTKPAHMWSVQKLGIRQEIRP